MEDTAKYLIHATVGADGVVERSDVVGAIFGQTEGLLGDDLDLRSLQQTSKVGRIDVEVASEAGRSAGTVTIASRLDKVETAILAAALETIDRVGPCEATVRVTDIEDVRQAKRRRVVERAKDLLAASFDGDLMSSAELVEEVRESVRVERITDFEGLPAGPRVETSDAVIVVEGRADVLTLLKYGIKNAIAVEGTNVPDAVAALTEERTVTAFLDGDRGGDLILRELDQVGDVDYVAFAPEGRSVEDLARHEVLSALRDKVPFEMAMAATEDGSTDAAGPDRDDGPAEAAPETEPVEADVSPDIEADDGHRPDADEDLGVDGDDGQVAEADDGPGPEGDDDPEVGTATSPEPDPPGRGPDAREASIDAESADGARGEGPAPGGDQRLEVRATTLADHVAATAGAGVARLLDAENGSIAEVPVDEAFDALAGAEPVPETVVLDGTLTQRLLDLAAQRGVDRVIARGTGEFTKQPTGVRVILAGDFEASDA